MANERWHVAVGGSQLPGDHDTAQVREILTKNAGKDVQVWTAGMAGWAEAKTLSQFQEAPAPSKPSPAPAPDVPKAEAPPPRTAAATPIAGPSRPATPSPRPAMPVSAAELQEQAGVFKALLDTSFNVLLTPRLIKAVYIIVMVVLGLVVAGGILVSLAGFAAGFARGIVGLVMSVVIFPLVALLYLAIFRMSLEVIMAIFKIKEHTAFLAEKARHDSAGD